MLCDGRFRRDHIGPADGIAVLHGKRIPDRQPRLHLLEKRAEFRNRGHFTAVRFTPDAVRNLENKIAFRDAAGI